MVVCSGSVRSGSVVVCIVVVVVVAVLVRPEVLKVCTWW